MPSLFKRLRRRHDPAAAAAPRRRRYLPPPSRLRRERRALLGYRERRIHELGGLVLEMYRQDQFRQDVVHEQAAEIVSLEERMREVDRLLAARTGRGDQVGGSFDVNLLIRLCPDLAIDSREVRHSIALTLSAAAMVSPRMPGSDPLMPK